MLFILALVSLATAAPPIKGAAKATITAYHESSGAFQSPNYPQVYPDNLKQRWVINPAELSRIQLDFDKNKLLDWYHDDEVYIYEIDHEDYDGDNYTKAYRVCSENNEARVSRWYHLSRLSRNYQPFKLVTNDAVAIIVDFCTDEENEFESRPPKYQGFKASFVVSKREPALVGNYTEMNEENGYIHSPSVAPNGGRFAHRWVIAPRSGNRVALTLGRNADPFGVEIIYYEATSRKAITDLPICGYATKCHIDRPVPPHVTRCEQIIQQHTYQPFMTNAPNSYVFIDMCTDLPLKTNGFIAEYSTSQPLWS